MEVPSPPVRPGEARGGTLGAVEDPRLAREAEECGARAARLVR